MAWAITFTDAAQGPPRLIGSCLPLLTPPRQTRAAGTPFATRQNAPPRAVLTLSAAARTIRATAGIGWATGPLDGWWRNRAAAAGDRCGTFRGILHAPLKVGRIRRATPAPLFIAEIESRRPRDVASLFRGRGGLSESGRP